MIFCLGEGRFTSSGIGYQQNLMIFNKKLIKKVRSTAEKPMTDDEVKDAKKTLCIFRMSFFN